MVSVSHLDFISSNQYFSGPTCVLLNPNPDNCHFTESMFLNFSPRETWYPSQSSSLSQTLGFPLLNRQIASCDTAHFLCHSSACGIHIHFFISALMCNVAINKGVQISLGVFMPLPMGRSQQSSFHSFTITVLIDFLRTPRTIF